MNHAISTFLTKHHIVITSSFEELIQGDLGTPYAHSTLTVSRRDKFVRLPWYQSVNHPQGLDVTSLLSSMVARPVSVAVKQILSDNEIEEVRELLRRPYEH